MLDFLFGIEKKEKKNYIHILILIWEKICHKQYILRE